MRPLILHKPIYWRPWNSLYLEFKPALPCSFMVPFCRGAPGRIDNKGPEIVCAYLERIYLIDKTKHEMLPSAPIPFLWFCFGDRE